MNPFVNQARRVKSWLRSLTPTGPAVFVGSGEAPGGPSHPTGQYVRVLLQSLAVFRFFAFAMGVALTWSLQIGEVLSLATYALLVTVGTYNIASAVFQFNLSRHSPLVQGISLASDLALSLSLLLVTGGLDSAFLIYSLSPILAASLLMNARAAGAAAAVSALAVVALHLPITFDVVRQPSVLSGNYLAFALLYAAACLLVFYLPFFANLNWERRVRTESRNIEHQRLRREIHDNVAQTLAYLSLKLNRAEERAIQDRIPMNVRDLREITNIVERCYISVRDYLDGATDPSTVEPLSATISKACQQWGQATGLRAPCTIIGREPDLPPQVRYQLLQITREALANVAKHAATFGAQVSLEYASDQLALRIRDAGRGFLASQSPGHGLAIMSERAAMIGASVSVTSAPGAGTEVVATYIYAKEKVAP